MMRGRSGLTLVETLVAISIVGVLAAVLIPAVQASREAARRATCQDHLKQVGLAVQEHANGRGALPSLYNGTFLPQPRWLLDEFHFHSWRSAILPGLEGAATHAALNFALPATVPANRTAVNVALATFACPSTSNPTRVVPDIGEWTGSRLPMSPSTPRGTAARADYEAVGGIQVAVQTKISSDLACYEFGAWGEPTYDTATGAVIRYRSARLADITDGLGQTILVAERSGRPDLYRAGKLVRAWDPAATVDTMDQHQATWALSTHFNWLLLPQFGGVNASNYGIYSFHPGGAHVAPADGSVRFLRDSVAPAVLKALVTRAGAEVVPAD